MKRTTLSALRAAATRALRSPSLAPRPMGGMLAALAGLASLAGCANIGSVAPGTPLSDVEQRYGQPTLACTRANGERHAVWSQQPEGSYAWGADVAKDGRIGPVQQTLTDEHFRRLGQGDWTPEAVRCEFGPPFRIGAVGLGDARQIVWSYRYMRANDLHWVMYVYFGADGDRVTRFQSGPDDRYQRSE